MKTRNILKKLPCLSLFFAALSMSGCISDRFEAVPAEKTGEFTFLIRVPGNATPSTAAGTRAIDEGGTNDNRVDAIDILLFDASTDKFVRSVYCMNINETGDVKVKSVRARLPQGSYKAVILANSHQQLIDHPISEGTLKAAALAQFTETLDYGTVWNSLPGSAGYRDFPMWGEVAGTVTVPSAGTITVDLHRMVAKANLSVAYTETTPGTPDFVLKDIRVYNYNRSGYLAPADADWAANPKQPTHYASREYPANQTTPTALLYDNTTGANATRTPKYITTDAAGKFYKSVDEIFIFESAADNSTWSWEKNTCLVLGGEYKGLMGYYRIDFAQSNVNIDILRNHSYNFSVEAVRNQGYATPEEALKNRPENMLYNIVVWDEHNITDIVFDGQYYLGVSQNAFELTREERDADDEDNKLKIRTDVPTGWTAAAWNNLAGDVAVVDDGMTGNPWLRISPTSGDGADTPANEMTLTMDANESGAERTAYIHIIAGRLVYIVKVTQTLASNLSLVLRDPVTLVEFQEYTWIVDPDGTPEDVRFDLLWGPRTSDVNISNVKAEDISSGTFIFDQSTGYKYIVPGNSTIQGGQANSGKESYTIRPATVTTAMLNADQWYDKSSKIEFTVNDGQSGVLKKTIYLRHWYPNVIAETEDKYIIDGSAGSTFTIKSNTDFTVEIATEMGNNPTAGDGNPVVTLVNPASTIYPANTVGTAIGFTLADDISNDPVVLNTQVKLIIKSLEGKFADKEVVLICVSYRSIPRITIKEDKLAITYNAYDAGLLFKWGSTVGIYTGHHALQTFPLTNNDTFDAGDVAFNASSVTITNNWATVPYGDYTHTLANVRAGKGDPCRLIGMTTSEIAGFANDAAMIARENELTTQGIGGWRMPTHAELQLTAPPDFRAATTYTTLIGYDINGFMNAQNYMVPIVGVRDNSGTKDISYTCFWQSNAELSPGGLKYRWVVGYDPISHNWVNEAVYGSTPDIGFSIRCVRK